MEEKSRQAKKNAKAAKKSKKSKSSSTASGDASEETVKINAEDFMKDGELDQEQLENLIKQLKLEKKGEEEGEKKPTHDEL